MSLVLPSFGVCVLCFVEDCVGILMNIDLPNMHHLMIAHIYSCIIYT